MAADEDSRSREVLGSLELLSQYQQYVDKLGGFAPSTYRFLVLAHETVNGYLATQPPKYFEKAEILADTETERLALELLRRSGCPEAAVQAAHVHEFGRSHAGYSQV